jgi:hypothetical protein
MDCNTAQESLLESLVEAPGADRRLAMESHIATCGVCGRFAEVHRRLDSRLAAAMPVGSLSAGFRTAVREKIRREAAWAWPDTLPDIAHLIGCALATGVSAILAPEHAKTVLLLGSAFTGVTYFVQAVLRSSLERAEGDV